MRSAYRYIFVIPLLLSVACDSNKINPSDTVSSRSYAVAGFDALEVATAFTVFVETGRAEEGVRVETNDNIHEYTEVFIEAGKLVIRLKKNSSISGNLTLRAYVQAGKIEEFRGAEASRIFLDNRVVGQTLKISLSGASTLGGEAELQNLSASLSGASTLTLEGSVSDYFLSASGASRAGSYEFVVSKLSTQLSGASEMKATVDDELSVNASGASILYYKGSSQVVDVQLSGGSQLIKM